MIVAIGPVILLLASILLGAVLLLGAFGILLWISRQQRQSRDKSEGLWQRDPPEIGGPDGTSIVASGK
jgi:hypothetical protein